MIEGRNLNQAIQANINEHVLSDTGRAIWAIYDGELSNGRKARGYVAEEHAADCVPLGMLRSGASIEKLTGALTVIKFDKSISVKQHYKADEWFVLSTTVRPTYGDLIPNPKGERSNLMTVPRQTPPSLGNKERINSLRQGLSAPDKNYPDKDEEWWGGIRQGVSIVETYLPGAPVPVMALTKEQVVTRSASTVKSHAPEEDYYEGYRNNPLATQVPSTSVVPTKPWIPYLGEALAITTLMRMILGLLEDDKENKVVRKSKTKIYPTEFIDYAELRRK